MMREVGKEAGYLMMYPCHCVADLSQPGDRKTRDDQRREWMGYHLVGVGDATLRRYRLVDLPMSW